MRNAFINELIQCAADHPDLYLLTGDLGFSVLETFIQRFPDRFINVGVAEQNMIGVATGLALSGKTVFCYSINNFATLRCLEQIRNDVCYHGANVKIISVGSGYSYGSLGYTHYGVEDMSILRSLPNINIISPADPLEAKLALRDAISQSGPFYIRLGKTGEPLLHPALADLTSLPHLLPIINAGFETTVLCIGSITQFVRQKIHDNELAVNLWSVPYLKPMDNEALLSIALHAKKLITVEEHQLAGGFGSAILESLYLLKEAGKLNVIPEVRRIGIDHPLIATGNHDYLRSKIDFSSLDEMANQTINQV